MRKSTDAREMAYKSINIINKIKKVFYFNIGDRIIMKCTSRGKEYRGIIAKVNNNNDMWNDDNTTYDISLDCMRKEINIKNEYIKNENDVENDYQNENDTDHLTHCDSNSTNQNNSQNNNSNNNQNYNLTRNIDLIGPSWTPYDKSSVCQCCQCPFTWHSTFRGEAQEYRERYNCRNCGSLVCGPCSIQRRAIPRIGLIQPSRVCDKCFHKVCVTI